MKEGKVQVLGGFEAKSAEKIQQLASGIHHDVVMCDLQPVMDPLDEALKTDSFVPRKMQQTSNSF